MPYKILSFPTHPWGPESDPVLFAFVIKVFSGSFVMHLKVSVVRQVRQVCPATVGFTKIALIREWSYDMGSGCHTWWQRERLDTHQPTAGRAFEGRGKHCPSSINSYLSLKNTTALQHKQRTQLTENTRTGQYLHSSRLMRDCWELPGIKLIKSAILNSHKHQKTPFYL